MAAANEINLCLVDGVGVKEFIQSPEKESLEARLESDERRKKFVRENLEKHYTHFEDNGGFHLHLFDSLYPILVHLHFNIISLPLALL